MDFDLSGMDEATAKSYAVSLVAHLKQTEAEVAAIDREWNLWKGRIATAEAAGRDDLANQARAQCAELETKKLEREAEVATFRTGVESMKRQLRLLPALQRSIDPDTLLQGLEELGGKTDTVTPALKKQEAEDALAALKKRLAEGS